ncbi:hypothetical protein T492DRAFT_847346 [Pavlovales sp. CCMP2436]|nr:hypothetical protein T492DRAFT_847346 [Pavlovales sp. CCMP2436]
MVAGVCALLCVSSTVGRPSVLSRSAGVSSAVGRPVAFLRSSLRSSLAEQSRPELAELAYLRDIAERAHVLPAEEVLKLLGVNFEKGLGPSAVVARRAVAGPNSLPEEPCVPFWRLALAQLSGGLARALLLAAAVSAAVAFFDGSPRSSQAFAEPAAILAILLLNAAPLRSSVIRDGQQFVLDASDLVPGDVLILRAGDAVPADCRIVSLASSAVSAEQAMLTGEPEAVHKQTEALPTFELTVETQGRTNLLFASTNLAYGGATAVVIATGARTAVGCIGALVRVAELDTAARMTTLGAELDKLGAELNKRVGWTCAGVWLLSAPHFSDATLSGATEGATYYLKIALALAVAAVPEGLPAVVTACLALGTRRMAERSALARSLPAVETLGLVTVVKQIKSRLSALNFDPRPPAPKFLPAIAQRRSRRFAEDLHRWLTGLRLAEHTIEGPVKAAECTLTTGKMCAREVITFARGGQHLASSAGSSSANPAGAAADAALAASLDVHARVYSVSGTSYAPTDGGLSFEEQAPGAGKHGEDGEAEPAALGKGGALFWAGAVASLCSRAIVRYEVEAGAHVCVGDGMEGVLIVLAEKMVCYWSVSGSELENGGEVRRAANYWGAVCNPRATLEFTRERKSMSVLCEVRGAGARSPWLLLVKGSPEALINRASHIMLDGEPRPLNAPASAALLDAVRARSSGALRFLALAIRPLEAAPLAACLADPTAFEGIESGLQLVAFVSVSQDECARAGIRTLVITGDDLATALAVCTEASILSAEEVREANCASPEGRTLVLTGRQWDALDDQDQAAAARTLRVLARAEPVHKLSLVRTLQAMGEVVAMTGDGVNDAPALKQADVGVAMGSGTAVARAAADLVLADSELGLVTIFAHRFTTYQHLTAADDNLSTIVSAIEEGRAIYASTQACVRFLLSSNLGEVLCLALCAGFGLPAPLLPLQLLWVNLVTDGLPALALCANPRDPKSMDAPPRSRDQGFVDHTPTKRADSLRPPLQTYGRRLGAGRHLALAPPEFSVAAVSTDAAPNAAKLLRAQMLNALNVISTSASLVQVPPWANRWLLAAAGAGVAQQLLLLYVPALNRLFGTAPLARDELLAVLALSLPVIALDECFKAWSRSRVSDE